MGFGCIGGLYCTIRRCWVSFSDGDRIKTRCHVITVLGWRRSNASDELKITHSRTRMNDKNKSSEPSVDQVPPTQISMMLNVERLGRSEYYLQHRDW